MSVEQRLELTWPNNSLKSLGRAFWENFVAEAGAKVISVIENDELSAYLLSESSLFIWPDRALMITCGQMKSLTSLAVDRFRIVRGPSVFRLEIEGWNEASKAFFARKRPEADVRRYLGLTALWPDFAIDDHAFSPYGYSLNAIQGGDYYTIHISPELCGGHISFETNRDDDTRLRMVTHRLLELFEARPPSFASP